MRRGQIPGWHKVHDLVVYWVYGKEVKIMRDDVEMDLYVHDRRHGGDGYSRVPDLHLMTYASLYAKILRAVDESNDYYVLREAVA